MGNSNKLRRKESSKQQWQTRLWIFLASHHRGVLLSIETTIVFSLIWDRTPAMLKLIGLIVATLIPVYLVFTNEKVTKYIEMKLKSWKLKTKSIANFIMTGLFIVIIILEGFTYRKPILSWISPPSKLTLEYPTYIPVNQDVSISLGIRGITVTVTWQALETGKSTPISGLPSFNVYILNRQLYTDVIFYGDAEHPLLQIRGNEPPELPVGWDFNRDALALEIVNAQKQPIFQMYYDTPFHMVLNGKFPDGSGNLIYASEGGMGWDSTNYHLTTIFKYPSTANNLGVRR